MTDNSSCPSDLVSVVIPVFNGMNYLEETVQSVIAQDYPEIELILVDGGSSDGSKEWIENFNLFPVKRDYLPTGSGAAACWTRACELATGNFVKLLCQDDLIYPHAISTQIAGMKSNSIAKIAFAQRDIIRADGKILSSGRGCQGLNSGLVSGTEALLAGYRAGTNIYGEPEAVLFDRRVLQASLPWSDAEPFLLDMFFYAKILSRHPALVQKQVIGAFRISSSSWSTRLVGEQRKQFRSWQRSAAAQIGYVSFKDRLTAFINNEKTTILRRMAYFWLRLRNDLNRD